MNSEHSTPLPPDLIQIAGIHDIEEAQLLHASGVDLAGIPLRLPVNAEDLTESAATELVGRSPLPCVLITYLDSADALESFAHMLGVRWLQIHGDISLHELTELRRRQPAWRLFKSLVVRENRNLHTLLEDIAAFGPYVDAFITDTFDPTTGATGATGRVHDWSISRQLVLSSSCPIILAGGLTPDNVASAITQVRPAGVDAHTGVEGVDGRKDPHKVERFVAEARRAWTALGAAR